MLSALNNNNEKIIAKDANKNNEYFCPVCGEPLILKQGEIKIPHFAHKANSGCSFGINESENHMLMKGIIRDFVVKGNKVVNDEFEHILKFSNGRYLIADYYAEIQHNGRIFKVAFEIVEKHDNYDEFEAKNVTYFDNDIYVVWVFNDKHINRYPNEHGVGEEFRTKQIHRVAHALGFGKVYSINIPDRKMYYTHFHKVERVRDSWDDRGYYVTYPKTIRIPESKEINIFKINNFKKQYPDKYVHFNVCRANMYIPKRWSKNIF